MIKAEDKGSGVAVSITGSDMTNIMDEFAGIVSALMQLLAGGDIPMEVCMMGIHTAVLTGMTKALNQFDAEHTENDDEIMDILKEAMKKEHEGE